MFTPPIRIDRQLEVEIRRIVPVDEFLGRFLKNLGL